MNDNEFPTEESSEYSPSGAPVYRHEERKSDFELATGDSENIEIISQHIEKYIGPVATVFHELVSDLVHIDVHLVAPDEGRDFYTLVTSGMSDRAMSAPSNDYEYAEMVLQLPPDWRLSQEDFNDENNYWPIRWMKQLARLPHEYSTWIGVGHTVPNGDPPQPFAKNTGLTNWMLLPPIHFPAEFAQLPFGEDKTINFLQMFALHTDELQLKLEHGADALIEKFEAAQLSSVLEPARASVVGGAPKKRRFRFPF